MIASVPDIEIYSDIVCPWCFIGKRRLDAAILEVRRDLADWSGRTMWRPSFLNPDTPSQGEPYLPFLERKFGGCLQVEALFQRGAHVGDSVVLVRIAAEWGYDPIEVGDYLESDRGEDVVRKRARQARQGGIAMVPSFVVEGSAPIVGAEEPSLLAAAIRRARGAG